MGDRLFREDDIKAFEQVEEVLENLMSIDDEIIHSKGIDKESYEAHKSKQEDTFQLIKKLRQVKQEVKEIIEVQD